MGTEYVHVILSLLAVVALMLGLVFLLKKFKLTRYAANKHIKIINIVPVGAKEKIILMEVNNAILLVGATPNHIETLYVFNELESEQPLQKSNFVEQMETLTR